MNFSHCPIKIVSRNKGRSAVASAAYISGTRLENTWDGTTHDYTRKYREAEEALQRWQDNGETIDYKGWQKALKYLNTERMVLDIDLRDTKEDVRRLEVVKREYIKDKMQTKPERYGR